MGVNPQILIQARSHLNRASQDINPTEVDEDREEETESLDNGLRFDEEVLATLDLGADKQGTDTDAPVSPVKPQPTSSAPKRQKVSVDKYKANFERASAQFIVEGTRREYEQQFNHFLTFCADAGFVDSAEELEATFDSGNIPAETPIYIAYWIMKKCDKIDLETGEIRPLAARPGYGTAQKMRAAMSHKFGRDYQRGDQSWSENPLRLGTYIGNPSLSATVSQYMVSLRRTKIHDGEVVTSARAMDEHLLKKLFEFNTDEDKFPPDLDDDKPRKRNGEEPWEANRSLRLMLMLMYIISFLCLLRFDEVLRINWSWITLEPLPDGSYRLKISLPYRKTHQTGEIAPFYLYPNLLKPWLCPVTLYCQYSELVTNMRGYLFRKKVGGTFSQQQEDSMSSDSFLDCFRNNILDIKEDPRPFGTHSFRRGGCQYLAVTLRWPLRDVCTWGGWAENFDNPGTIFKYLLSFADTPTVAREDYFNPKRAKAERCAFCNRSCWCA